MYLLTSKCASRHNGVHFFISHLASWLRTRRFSEPTFRTSGATNHWKNRVFREFPTFLRICIFCLLTLSLLLFFLLIFLFSLPLPCSAFHLFHIVGSLTSKLPSIKHHVSCIYMYLKLTYVYLCVNCVCVFHVAFTSVTSFRSLLPVVQALKSIKNTASGLVATIGRPPNPGNQGCIGHETDLKKGFICSNIIKRTGGKPNAPCLSHCRRRLLLVALGQLILDR